VEGRVILYADTVTDSMKRAIDETDRRRQRQRAHNQAEGITPLSVKKRVADLMSGPRAESPDYALAAEELRQYGDEDLNALIARLRQEMKAAAVALDFEEAASIRDRVQKLQGLDLGIRPASTKGVGPASKAARGRYRAKPGGGVRRQ
jgi:excinuclease ABC subunit B